MKKLAIIGMGPRGLYALENLLVELSYTNQNVAILVFESTEIPGAGNVWHISQPDSNWINITERGLKGISSRPKIILNDVTIDAFPSYHNWSNFSQSDTDPDTFPPRKKLGVYLNERFNSITEVLKKTDFFQLIKSDVISLKLDKDKIKVETTENTWTCNDALLTIGHQPTELSDQLKAWEKHVNKHNKLRLFNEPYPISQLTGIKNKENLTVGIRGFGLAMIDVMRFLVINKYGNFKITDYNTYKSDYYKIETQHLKLIPFSLDGLPLAPKPLNKSIDDWYKPTTSEIEFIRDAIESFTNTNKDTHDIHFLTTPIAKVGARIFKTLKDKVITNSSTTKAIESILVKYLHDSDYTHKLIQDSTISTYQLIQSYIDMALGNTKISLDYCIWQVWRHCQPLLHSTISHAQLNTNTIKKIIALDERSKRFTYGPPIESMQQILALVDAKILDLSYTNDPEISLIEEGWELKNASNNTIVCHCMINSVLDSPQLLKINSPIIKNLLKDDLIQPVHSELGIETSEDGYVISNIKNHNVPIAVLGRLAKGSVLGVDAISECFGKRIEDWAKGYIKKLKE